MNSIINDTVNPLVSIIVPIYNTEKYLEQCIESLVHQTLRNIEIILIDDGSTDKSPALCDAYARQDPRVKVLHQKNSGYGKACNTGINAVRSEYFGIVESDDYTELDMFERLYNHVKNYDLDIVHCNYFFYNSTDDTHERSDLSHIPQNVVCSPRDVVSVFNQQPAVWSMLYRTGYIRKNNIKFLETPGASYQDTSFTFKVLALAERFMLSDDTLIHYRKDGENSSCASKEKVLCVCEEFDEIERFIEERDLAEKLLPIIPKLKFPTYMWNYRRLARKYRWDFLLIFSKEMRRYISERRITKDKYTAWEITKIYIIAFLFPVVYTMDKMSIII